MSVPFDVSAGLSALMYDIAGQSGIVGRTLGDLLNDSNYYFSHKDTLSEIVKANGLENVKIVDTSWQNEEAYGTMNAATFKFPNGDMYVAYRGTGNGNWSYNADSAYGNSASAMENWALDYFESTYEKHYQNSGQLYVTGHSQGGNNAMYVAFFSKYGSLITNCISIDGPGFNTAIVEEAKRLWGESYFELQRQKSYGVYGENDYVHGQGDVQTTPIENTFFIPTSSATGIEGYHDIFTHFENGKLTGHPDDPKRPPCVEGPISKLVSTLVDNLLRDLPADKRYDVAVIVMDIIEMAIGSGEGSTETADILGLIVAVGPTILETALHNPANVMAVMFELGVHEMIAKWLDKNPAVIAGLILGAPILVPLVAKTVAFVYVIDAAVHIVQGVIKVVKDVKNFVLNGLNAIKNAFGKINEFFRSFNTGVRYANANPCFKADTAKLRNYATRISNVNKRLKNLDKDLDGLYSQVRLVDISRILAANLLTSGSPTLNQIKSYLDNAAKRLEAADDKARGYVGG